MHVTGTVTAAQVKSSLEANGVEVNKASLREQIRLGKASALFGMRDYSPSQNSTTFQAQVAAEVAAIERGLLKTKAAVDNEEEDMSAAVSLRNQEVRSKAQQFFELILKIKPDLRPLFSFPAASSRQSSR